VTQAAVAQAAAQAVAYLPRGPDHRRTTGGPPVQHRSLPSGVVHRL